MVSLDQYIKAMSMLQKSHISIGNPGWEDSLRSKTNNFESAFWAGFKAVPRHEIDRIEANLRRKLPEDFKLFLSMFGSGDFPFKFGGGFLAPDEIIEGCAGPILMLAGSDAWASPMDQRRFYVSRGEFNPAPTKFTSGITRYADVDLLDLVQIGYDGMGCYYQLVCPARPDDQSGFCKITPEGTVEDRFSSFEEGLNGILSRFREMESER